LAKKQQQATRRAWCPAAPLLSFQTPRIRLQGAAARASKIDRSPRALRSFSCATKTHRVHFFLFRSGLLQIKKNNRVTRARLRTRLLSGDHARSRQRARPQTWSVLPRGLAHLAHVREPQIKIQGTTYEPTWSRSFGINAPWIDQTRRDFCLAVCVALPHTALVQSQRFLSLLFKLSWTG
jgi:hypothetical protein